MAKKAAKKESAAKTKSKPAAKPVAKAVAKATAKPEALAKAPKKAKTEAAEKVKALKVDSEAPAVEAKAEAPVKAPKVPKVKVEKISAAQRKLDKAAADSTAHWAELQQKHGQEKPQAYDMKLQFEAHRPLQHKVLGWGWVMSVENDRVEVIFQDGKRILISNYKTR